MDNQDLDNLELYQLMAEIKPVTEPTSISMWPQGPGWTVLIVILIITALIVYGVYRFKRYKQRHRLAAIEAIKTLDNNSSALTISSILKRCALYDFKRSEIASLTGVKWSEFLNKHCDKHKEFINFDTLPENYDQEALKQQAITWLTHYKVVS